MIPFLRKRFLLILIVLGIGMIGFQRTQPRPTRQRQPIAPESDTHAAPPAPTPASTRAKTKTPLPASSLPNAAEPESLTPAPVAIQELFPSVKTAVLNWREYRPDTYTVRAGPHRPVVTFRVEQIKDEGAFTTWIGRSSLQGESFVAVASKDGLDAILTTYDGQPVEIHVRGANVATSADDAFSEVDGCGALPNQNLTVAAAAAEPAILDSSSFRAEAAEATQSRLVDASGNWLSRVACFYDSATLAYANLCAPDGNGASLINSTFRARLEAGNVALANSQINVRWVYLGCALAPTAASTKVEEIFNELISVGVLGDFARQKAAEWGAAQILLTSQTINGSFAGCANLPGHYAVAYWNRNYFLMAHELSHNFGLRHDRYTDNAIATPNDGIYAYAIDLISTTSSNRQIVGTIMSYAHYFVPYFSNANLTLSSALTTHFYTADYSGTYQLVPPVYTDGTAGNFYNGSPNGTINDTLITSTGASANVQPLGIPAGQPYAADGSRIFRESASTIVNGGWYVEPIITSQPQSQSVERGQSFTLSITTYGVGTFAYQWYKGATAIPGATGTSYSVTNPVDSDFATYSVVVTVANITGLTSTLTSNNATVTVKAPPPEPSPTSNNGGGGGATSSAYFTALTILVIARLRRPIAHKTLRLTPIIHPQKRNCHPTS